MLVQIDCRDALASMEPLFFKAENTPYARSEFLRAIASMEPLFFKAENGRNG